MKDTPNINADHPRIKNRTPEHQQYRDGLAENLKADRASGKVGKLLAEDRLKEEQKNIIYTIAKYGFTKKLCDKMLESGNGLLVVILLDKFEEADHDEIAKALIKAGEIRGLVNDLDKFKGTIYSEIAKALIEDGLCKRLANNLGKFKELDVSIGEILIGKGYADQVRKNIKSFKQADV